LWRSAESPRKSLGAGSHRFGEVVYGIGSISAASGEPASWARLGGMLSRGAEA
jgi:hypothetical protein